MAFRKEHFFSLSAFLTHARTVCPLANNSFTRCEPTYPDAPVTATIEGERGRAWLIFTLVFGSRLSEDAEVRWRRKVKIRVAMLNSRLNDADEDTPGVRNFVYQRWIVALSTSTTVNNRSNTFKCVQAGVQCSKVYEVRPINKSFYMVCGPKCARTPFLLLVNTFPINICRRAQPVVYGDQF